MKGDKPLKSTLAALIKILNRNDNALILLSKDQLSLLSEATLKKRDEICNISDDKLTQLLKQLCQNVFDGLSHVASYTKPQNGAMGVKFLMEPVEAAIVILRILTAPNIPHEIFKVKGIDQVINLTRKLLELIVYPALETSYTSCGKSAHFGKGKKDRKRPPILNVDKPTQQLYSKIVVIVNLLAEYFKVEKFGDAKVLSEVVKLAVEPFFVESAVVLREPSLRILNQVIKSNNSKDIWTHLIDTSMRLPGHKRVCDWFPLEPATDVKVSPLSAIVFRLLQDVVSVASSTGGLIDDETLEMGMKKTEDLTDAFLEIFVLRMIERWEDRDCKYRFEAFNMDIATTMFHPRWPIAETVASKFGGYLYYKITSDRIDPPSRLICIEMFGCVTIRVCHLQQRVNQRAIKIVDFMQTFTNELDSNAEITDDTSVSSETLFRVPIVQQLQNAILGNLAPTGKEVDPQSAISSTNSSARLYYIALWSKDLRLAAEAIDGRRGSPGRVGKGASRHRACQTITALPELELTNKSRDILLGKANGMSNSDAMKLSPAELQLASQHLTVSRSAFMDWKWYRDQLLELMSDSTMTVRNRVTRFLRTLIEVDVDLLNLGTIQEALLMLLNDKSASVRETTVDLVGKVVQTKPEILNVVFCTTLKMLKDASMGVKKRCIRLLRDLTCACPDYPHLQVYSAHVLCQIADSNVQKIVMETLEQIWFTMPINQTQLASRTSTIVALSISHPVSFQTFLDVLVSNRDGGLDLVKVPPPESTISASRHIMQHIVNCLTSQRESSMKRCNLLETLFYMTKALPQLGARHSVTVLNFINAKSKTDDEVAELRYAAQILELTLPSLTSIDPKVAMHAERAFIEALGPNVSDANMVATCVSCLSLIVRKITKNYSPVRKMFQKSINILKDYKVVEIDDAPSCSRRPRPSPSRHLFIAAMILKMFDVNPEGLSNATLGNLTVNECLEIYCALARHPTDTVLNLQALKAIGWILITHPHHMMIAEVHNLYRDSLLACTFYGDNDTKVPNNMACIRVLENISFHITEEETLNTMFARIHIDEDLNKAYVCENMARTLVLIHLCEILKTTFSTSLNVRMAASTLMQNIVSYEVVLMHQVLPNLIVMSSDPCPTIAKNSLKILANLHRRFPVYLPPKLIDGVKLLYKFLREVETDTSEAIVRGRKTSEDNASAVISGIYALIRPDQTIRRNFLDSMLKLFEPDAKTSLAQMVYLADILAHLPYQKLDDPMYLVSRLDFICALSCGNLEDDGSEMPNTPVSSSSESDKSAGPTAAKTEFRKDCTIRSHVLRLLLTLRGYVKTVYSITDSKLVGYLPTDANAQNRQATRRLRPPFEPTAVLDVVRNGEEIEAMSDADFVQVILDLKQLMMDQDSLDIDGLQRFDKKVNAINKSMQRNRTKARSALAASSIRKRSYAGDEAAVGEKGEAPKKRKVASKNSTVKEVKLVKTPVHGKKMAPKCLF